MLNQTFPVIYRNNYYMVDPSCLSSSSRKFKELLNYFLDTGYDIQSLRLKIEYDKFSERNIYNFLKLCQNQQTDVQNSEVQEICDIAKMFRADEIYNKGITFIQNSIDPNFFIPYNKYSDKQYLFIETDDTNLIHHANLNELEFDDDYNNTNPSDMIKNNNCSSKNQSTSNDQNVKYQSVCYQIQVETPFMKCRRFQFIKDGVTIFTGKQKDNEIVISAGNNAHINENKQKNDARITQNREGFNIITTEDQTFRISYVAQSSIEKKYSLNLSFIYKKSELSWSTKIPRSSTTINGENNHVPLPSKKNIILQNPAGQITFIVRKMKKKLYEAECHLLLSPIIAFSIAISQIVGPYYP